MNQNQSITEIMLKHHIRIIDLLNVINDKAQHKDAAMANVISKFRWELEKHFFLEEKAIFQLHYSKNVETNRIKTRLKKEHNNLIERFDKIEEDLKNNSKIDIAEFRKHYLKHMNFENKFFYPRLDKELDDDRKMMIIERITDSV